MQNVTLVADRIIYAGVSGPTDLEKIERLHSHDQAAAVFLLEESQPFESTLQKYLETTGRQSAATNLPVPPESIAVFKTARQNLWKLIGARAPVYGLEQTQATNAARIFGLKLYRLSPESR